MTDTTGKPRALLALHHEKNLETASFFLEEYGYEITATQKRGEFLKRVRENKFDVYIWDANLGSPASMDLSVTKEVWSLLKERYRRGEIKIRAVSNTPEAVRQVQREGIPAEYTVGLCMKEFAYFKRE